MNKLADFKCPHCDNMVEDVWYTDTERIVCTVCSRIMVKMFSPNTCKWGCECPTASKGKPTTQ